jgi:hypothetical protein
MAYTAVVLTNESRNLLIASAFGDVCQNRLNNWEVKCHHMTIDLKPIAKSMAAHLDGQEVELRVTKVGSLGDNGGFGVHFGIRAVMVECEVPSKNAVKHITVAHHPTVKAKTSNEITEWTDITPFTLRGVVQEVA